MCGTRTGTDTPLLGGFKWLPWGPPFALRKAGGWRHNVGIQVLWDLTTVARQPGATAASALKPSHILILMYILRRTFQSDHNFCLLSPQLF